MKYLKCLLVFVLICMIMAGCGTKETHYCTNADWQEDYLMAKHVPDLSKYRKLFQYGLQGHGAITVFATENNLELNQLGSKFIFEEGKIMPDGSVVLISTNLTISDKVAAIRFQLSKDNVVTIIDIVPVSYQPKNSK